MDLLVMISVINCIESCKIVILKLHFGIIYMIYIKAANL